MGRLLVCLGLFAVLLAASRSFLSGAVAAPQASYKLSRDGPLPIGGEVQSFEVSADNQVMVDVASQELAELN